jgi:uncharacterized protein
MRRLTTMTLLILTAMSTMAIAQTGNCLYFSEYIEGSSNNKALEIYNATDGPVSLGNVQILLYSNGAAAPSSSLTLTAGTLANGGTYVVANPLAAAAVLTIANQTSASVISYNGDDAIELRYNGVTVDVIGQIGVDPGTSWGVEPNTTVNHTMTRNVSVCCGDAIGNNAFDPAVEWVVYAQDTYGYLGSHATLCQAVPAEGQTWGSFKSLYR